MERGWNAHVLGHADHTFKDALTAVTTLRVRHPLLQALVHASVSSCNCHACGRLGSGWSQRSPTTNTVVLRGHQLHTGAERLLHFTAVNACAEHLCSGRRGEASLRPVVAAIRHRR